MQNIIHQFQENLNSIELSHQKKYLLAVSGGIDSMVLCEMFRQLNLNFSVAHCNFQLRGNDSDLDQQSVEEYCTQNKVELFSKRFDVKKFKETGNFSTQMAARELRYNWFFELKEQFQFNFIVTAHHLNDSLETFLINLSRGTGLQGLQGIPLLNDYLLRPLYNISKESIENFAQENQIKWREDISNQSDDYLRNKIRHHIIPHFSEINRHFLNNFSQTIHNLQDDQLIIQAHLAKVKDEIFQFKENEIQISIEQLKQLNPLSTYLFYLFDEFGFHHPAEILKLMESNSSAEIQSKTHRLIKNRNELILIHLPDHDFPKEFVIEEDGITKNPLNLIFSRSTEKKIDALETLDFTEIQFPIKLRKPRTGDEFHPLGLNGHKKLSKFCKDLKLSKTEKEKIWLLVDDSDQILYVVGYRIDERYKLRENTHNFLNIYSC